MPTHKQESVREPSKTQVMLTEEQNKPQTSALTPREVSLLMAEHSALREEIVKRIELEYQLVALAIIAPGTILAIGFQTNNASLLLLYPVLAWLLSSFSLANIYNSHYLASYIRDHIETRISKSNIGWEHFKISTKPEPFYIIGFLASRGIFIATEILALVAGAFIARFSVKETIFLIIGSGSTVCNMLMVIAVEAKRRGGIKWPYSGPLKKLARQVPDSNQQAFLSETKVPEQEQ